jgi:hypothetical protein
MTSDFPEQHESLWVLVAPLGIWAVHFVLSYGTAAIWCAKYVGPDGSLAFARGAIAAYTVLALAAVAVVGWRGFRRQTATGASSRTLDAPLDRHRFLGFVTVLLSCLSALAILYAALVVVIIGSCR